MINHFGGETDLCDSEINNEKIAYRMRKPNIEECINERIAMPVTILYRIGCDLSVEWVTFIHSCLSYRVNIVALY